MDSDIRKIAVDALYNARESDKVMDTAAELVATAVLEKVSELLQEESEQQENSQRRLGYKNSAIIVRDLAHG